MSSALHRSCRLCQRPRTNKNNTATVQRAALKIQDDETKKNVMKDNDLMSPHYWNIESFIKQFPSSAEIIFSFH